MLPSCLSTTDYAGEPRPHDSVAVPVLASIGINNWPNVESFEELPTAVQFAWAANRGTGDTNEQQADFFVSGQSTPANQNQYGNWHGVAATNHNFISYYYQSGSSGYSKAQVDASWQAYLNWMLGIVDGARNCSSTNLSCPWPIGRGAGLPIRLGGFDSRRTLLLFAG